MPAVLAPEPEQPIKVRPWGDRRPTNYFKDCYDRPRPCPWVGCPNHMLLDINPENGTIIFNVGQQKEDVVRFGRRRARTVQRKVGVVSIKSYTTRKQKATLKIAEESVLEALREMLEHGEPHSCLADAIGDGKSYTLEEVGEYLNLTRERVRQIEVRALVYLRAHTRQRQDMKTWEENRSDEQGRVPGKP